MKHAPNSGFIFKTTYVVPAELGAQLRGLKELFTGKPGCSQGALVTGQAAQSWPFSFQHTRQAQGHSPGQLKGQHAQRSWSSCQPCFTNGPAQPLTIPLNSDFFEENAKDLLESAAAAKQPDFQN